VSLTDKGILALKPRIKKYKIFDGDGLYLLIHPKGGKYWYMKYHINGRPREVSFGTYPEVSLKLARERREEARKQLAQDLDPQAQKRASLVARSILFADVAEEWLTMMSKPRGISNGRESSDASPGAATESKAALDPATVKKHRWVLDTYLKPALGKLPIGQITSAELLALLKKIVAAGKIETAHRVRSLAGRIFCYAHSTARSPQGDITWSLRDALPPIVIEHHASITNPDQVGELLLCIDGYTGDPPTRAALKLAPLTIVRPGELRFAEWSEFNFERTEWRIPAERMKMRPPHIVPLSKQALVELYTLKRHTGADRYLFPVLGSKEGVMSENTVNQALRRLGYSGNVIAGHGFRSMASTLLNAQQCWHADAIERQLAHCPRDKMRATYNYAEHLPERRKMMQAWADYLDELREAARARLAGQRSPSKAA